MISPHPAQANTSTLHQILVIMRLTFLEARRRNLMRLGLVLGLAFVGLFNLSFFFIIQDLRRAEPLFLHNGLNQFLFNTFLLSGLYVVNFLAIMISVLTSVGALSAEVETDMIHSIAAKPIRLWQIVIGKWLAHALMLTAYVLLMSGGLIFGVRIISGYIIPNALTALGILILEALVTLSLTMLGSSRLSTLANGVAVFMIYGAAFVGGWIEQIGAVFQSQTARNIGAAASYVMPCEALWRYAASQMQLTRPMGVGGTPFTLTTQPPPEFVGYAAIYALVGLIGAVWLFSRRDF